MNKVQVARGCVRYIHVLPDEPACWRVGKRQLTGGSRGGIGGEWTSDKRRVVICYWVPVLGGKIGGERRTSLADRFKPLGSP